MHHSSLSICSSSWTINFKNISIHSQAQQIFEPYPTVEAFFPVDVLPRTVFAILITSSFQVLIQFPRDSDKNVHYQRRRRKENHSFYVHFNHKVVNHANMYRSIARKSAERINANASSEKGGKDCLVHSFMMIQICLMTKNAIKCKSW